MNPESPDLIPCPSKPTRRRRALGPLGPVGLVLGVVVTIAGAVVGVPPAHANPNWALYNEGTSLPMTSTDVVVGTGSVALVASVNGAPRRFTCSFTVGAGQLTVTAPGALSAPPSGTVTLAVTPPASSVCTVTGAPPATFTFTGAWELILTMPPPGTTLGQLFNAATNATLRLPPNALAFPPTAGCATVGPTGPTPFGGSYDASTGTYVANPNQPIMMTTTGGCTFALSRLTSASITLGPVVDLQW